MKNFFLFFLNFILFLNFTKLYQFCQISKRIRHRYTCVPHTEPSSLLPPHTIPLGRPSALAPSIQYRASNSQPGLCDKGKLHDKLQITFLQAQEAGQSKDRVAEVLSRDDFKMDPRLTALSTGNDQMHFKMNVFIHVFCGYGQTYPAISRPEAGLSK